jgi:hypothetical protein
MRKHRVMQCNQSIGNRVQFSTITHPPAWVLIAVWLVLHSRALCGANAV